jgi:hypothetical protein
VNLQRTGRRIALICLLLAVAGLAPHRVSAQTVADDGSQLRVALVTAAPGEIYWERFGHNAILIEDSISGDQRMYNFGWFDFGQENFMLNFVRGRMMYMLAATDPARDIANYRAEGRSVWLQELDLDAAQKLALARKLAWNAQPENAEYRYDYYVDNCSTRVRDALDDVLGGALKRDSLGRGRGETYRSLSLAYARPITWLTLGIHLGLGPAADRRINFWEEAFLPLRLRDLAAELKIENDQGVARPLVSATRTLYAGPLDDRLPARPAWFWRFLAVGVVVALMIGLGMRSRHAGLRWGAAATAAAIGLLIGLIALGLAGLWLGTDHEIAWRNANLWLFCPLTLLLIGPLWRLRRVDGSATAAARGIAAMVFAIALLVLGSVLLKLNTQAQFDWLALLLPWHLMVWLSLSKAKA